MIKKIAPHILLIVCLCFSLQHHAASADTLAKLMTTIEDIQDKKIGVLLGSVHDKYAHAHYPNAQVMQYKSPSDLLLGVKTGKVDVGLFVHEMLLDMLRKDSSLGFLGETIEIHPVGYGFNKNNAALRLQFNQFLTSIKQDGTYDDMVNRWIKQGDDHMPDIKARPQHGQLVVGHISDSGLPFAAVKDNTLSGFNIELTRRFAAFIGKEVRFDDMEFGSLIPALASGKIDLIGMTLMITEERKTKIDFSDPYYELGMHAFALKKNIAAYQGQDTQTQPHGLWQSIVEGIQNNLIQEKRYLILLDGFQTTVLISLFAALFGTLLGGMVCFLRMSKKPALRLPAMVFIEVLRGIPVLVVLMIIFYVVFASISIHPIVVATLAFGLNFAAYAAEIFRSGIETIDKGQIEAGIAMGFSKVRTFGLIVLPQAIRRILPVYKGELITLVKMTSIVGYIAVQDLTKASDIIRSRTFDAFFPLILIALLYFLIAWALMQALDYIEKVSDPKFKRSRAQHK